MAAETKRPVVWGIMGTGAVAHDFTAVLQSCAGGADGGASSCLVKAVGSRSAASAEAFGGTHGIDVRYASYEELVADDEIDIIYIATPSKHHVEHSELCLRAGKHVLCEKTMATSAQGAARVLDLARERKRLFMHGVWTRHFPALHELRRMLRSGELGELRQITIDFNQAASASGEAALGEGALLETGVYPLAVLDFVLDGRAPDLLHAAGELSPGGAEKQVTMLLSYDQGKTLASLHCGLTVGTPREAMFVGTKATAVLPYPFWCPDRLLIKRDGGDQLPGSDVSEHAFPLPKLEKKKKEARDSFNFINSEGFLYEIEEANRCVREGLLESESVSADFNRRLLGLVERAREAMKTKG